MSAIHVEVTQIRRGVSGCQSKTEDAAGRGTCDKIEARGDGGSAGVALLQFGQNGGR